MMKASPTTTTVAGFQLSLRRSWMRYNSINDNVICNPPQLYLRFCGLRSFVHGPEMEMHCSAQTIYFGEAPYSTTALTNMISLDSSKIREIIRCKSILIARPNALNSFQANPRSEPLQSSFHSLISLDSMKLILE